ncbi:hypothetical protein [Halosimplex halophilum]|uniref:hypothetical protein n=1 Tax=Halosimplex halophilum TaxID=2559572 RepID=UPI00107F4574|nr:hypothetical protein [Halosimplex halophilum]
MFGPPPRRALVRYAAACLLVVAATGAAAAAATVATASTGAPADGASDPAAATATPTVSSGTAAASPGTPTPTATPRRCLDDEYDPPVLPADWTAGLVDHLSSESLDRWTGGRIAPVGAGGDCSLFVADGERATLSATTVDRSRGVVTGTLDLGANGSLRLIEADTGPTAAGAGAETTASTVTGASTSTTSGDDGAALAIENRGPDFSTEAVVAVGNRSERVALPSGRFFEFAVVRAADGDVRVALWGSDRVWNEEWDATFDSVPDREWRVRVDGRAFLDGLAVGTADPATPTAEPPVGDDTPTPTEDPFPEFPDDPDSGFEDPESERSGDSAFASTLLGLIVIGVGAVMVRYAYGISRFSEQLDAIGSTTPAHEVEPAAWNVALTKIGGGLAIAFGLYLVVSALL